MVLDEILERKHLEIEKLKQQTPSARLRQMAERHRTLKRSLEKVLRTNRSIHLICELKKASPSEGMLRREFNPRALAQEFEAAGASAISVLTEKYYFKGNPKTLNAIRPLTKTPLIRKDFIVDPCQIYETVLLGADAFLLIAMLLSSSRLRLMLRLGRELGLEAILEVHTKEELNRALEIGATLIGINNRNLKTLRIEPSVSEELIPLIPKEAVAIVESGIETRQEIVRFQNRGAHCFLVGTALMKSKNVGVKIFELYGKTKELKNGKS